MAAALPPSVRADLIRLGRLVQNGAELPWDGSDAEVAALLYSHWYLAPEPDGEDGPDLRPPRTDLAPLLRAAHGDGRHFESGWVVLAVAERGGCIVGKGEQRRSLLAGDYVNLRRPAVPVAPGEEVAAVAMVDRIDRTTGWWGTSSPIGEPAGRLSRHYLHPRVTGAAGIVALATAALGSSGVEWSLKLPTAPEGYRRPDAMVVYSGNGDTAAVRTLLLEVCQRAFASLRPHLPPLTERVTSLLAYADDPGGDHSYGSHLCAALAPGARALRAAPGADVLDLLAQALADAGIDPAAPWMGPDHG